MTTDVAAVLYCFFVSCSSAAATVTVYWAVTAAVATIAVQFSSFCSSSVHVAAVVADAAVDAAADVDANAFSPIESREWAGMYTRPFYCCYQLLIKLCRSCIKAVIPALLFQKLFMRSALDNLTMFKDKNHI